VAYFLDHPVHEWVTWLTAILRKKVASGWLIRLMARLLVHPDINWTRRLSTCTRKMSNSILETDGRTVRLLDWNERTDAGNRFGAF